MSGRRGTKRKLAEDQACRENGNQSGSLLRKLLKETEAARVAIVVSPVCTSLECVGEVASFCFHCLPPL